MMIDIKKGGAKMDENKPLLIYNKKADSVFNRVIIPKFFIEQHGREFQMEIYKDKIILIPIEKEE